MLGTESCSAGEAAEFAQMVKDVLAKHWRGGELGDLRNLMKHAAEQGWFELGGADALEMALVAMRELGAAACPLPVMDAFVAGRLLVDEQQICHEIACGAMRVLVVVGGASEKAQYLDSVDVATHLLRLDSESDRVVLFPIRGSRKTQGLPRPLWAEATTSEALLERKTSPEALEDAMLLWRLGLAARALGAAERTHMLAVAHSKVRRQFNRPIGAFGAVQQRTASTEIELSAASLLLDETVAAYGHGVDSWRLSAQIASEYISEITIDGQLAAHYTLGAIGYFDEHEAPWLFRRVHADVLRLRSMSPRGGSVGDRLIEGGSSLPRLGLSEEVEVFREDLNARLEGFEGMNHFPAKEDDAPELVKVLAEAGYLGMGWPEEYGGRRASVEEQYVLQDELSYRRLPATGALYAVAMLGRAIMEHGGEEQREKFLPKIARGEVKFCLGYSEPGSGSDLASLTTRAVKSGSGWQIDGQKIWTTGAHLSEYIWLAVKTDGRETQPQAALSVFIVSMSEPGITVQQHRGLSGRVSCSVFFDSVWVPDSSRIGEVDKGWEVVKSALEGERMVMGGVTSELRRQLDEIVDLIRRGVVLDSGRNSAVRAEVGRLGVRTQATRALVASALANIHSRGSSSTSAMAAVMGGELAVAFGETALKIIGPSAAMSGEDAAACSGAFEYGLRSSLMYVIGGGTNDVLRGLIARSMGLPR